MKLSGYLSEYSLAEIFNFIDEGTRTGLLTLAPDPQNSLLTGDSYYLWFQRGRIVALTTGLDGVGLLTRVVQRKLMTPAQIEPVGALLFQLSQPLGLYLKSAKFLDAEQLKLLFNAQTISPVTKLFEFKNRQFIFDPNKSPINAEMTGISLPARDVGLLGLRLLKDWSGLNDKLPDPHYAIQRCFSQRPNFELNRHELQLWNLADGKTPLNQLATKMFLSIEIIRQISFRLSTFGAIREIPTERVQSIDIAIATSSLDYKTQTTPLSSSFFGNLKSFLIKGGRKSSTKY